MSLIDEIRIAQRDAGEAAVIRNLERQGLGSVGGYATAEESASVMRPATPDEKWLHAQLDRIDPDRLEIGSAGDTPALIKLVFELRDQLADMETRKDGAYLERNQVVAALAKCFPSGVGRTAIEGWSDDWHGCVYIDLPTGQASWHFHDSQMHLLEGLPAYVGAWDGHTTELKYQRLAALKIQPEERHLDDMAVDFFAAAMRAKMKKQREKGYGGWENCPTERLQAMLEEHIAKGDPVDVGNFAMMLHCRGDATKAGVVRAERDPS